MHVYRPIYVSVQLSHMKSLFVVYHLYPHGDFGFDVLVMIFRPLELDTFTLYLMQ